MAVLRKYVPIKYFCEIHNANYRSIIQMKSRLKYYPDGVFKNVGKNGLFIDEHHFIRRKEFQSKVHHYLQDRFFEVNENMHLNMSEIARAVCRKFDTASYGGIYVHISVKLFEPLPDKITTCKIPKNAWFLYRYFRQLELDLS